MQDDGTPPDAGCQAGRARALLADCAGACHAWPTSSWKPPRKRASVTSCSRIRRRWAAPGLRSRGQGSPAGQPLSRPILRRGDEYFLKDLNSRNKTYLNDQEIDDQPRLLSDGDRLAVCDVLFTFHDDVPSRRTHKPAGTVSQADLPGAPRARPCRPPWWTTTRTPSRRVRTSCPAWRSAAAPRVRRT